MQTEQLLCWSGMTDTEHLVQTKNKNVTKSKNNDRMALKWFYIYS